MDRKTALLSERDNELDSFDSAVRAAAFERTAAEIENGTLVPDHAEHRHNMHCHTFYSYNPMHWSPSHLAVAAKLLGFTHIGKVEFDVLHGLDEFFRACNRLGLKGVCGMETRVFIPEMADHELNSPGEKGVAYHVGLGFRSESPTGKAKSFADDLAARAGRRTRTVVSLVNDALKDLRVDFDTDLLPLTPAGNPTERHACAAYRQKAASLFGAEALDFWGAKLSLSDAERVSAAKSDIALEGLIRSRLMKNGGPGCIKADSSSFPPLSEMNAFIDECGALPSYAWLNGFSSGEADPEKLLSFHLARGMRVLTIIPDRNWNIGDPVKREAAIRKLNEVMEAAAALSVPVVAGTELNSPGCKLFDDFTKEPLKAHYDAFFAGAEFVCAHTPFR